MRSSLFIAAALYSVESIAGLVAVPVRAPVSRNTDLEVFSTLEQRSSSVTLGSFSLATTKTNAVLFDITSSGSSGNLGEKAELKVTCKDCRTWGTALVTNSGVTKSTNIIGNIISFFKDPVNTIISAFSMDVKVSFENVGGHFEFDIMASDTVSYSIPIYTSESPVGIAVSEDVSIGLVLIIDLVFSLNAAVDLDAGFEFAFPEGAYITVDPLGGDIVDQGFTGGTTNNLPVTVTSGSATFKAALRVRVQAGTTVEIFGDGFDFELGVSADLIEYVAVMTSTPTCVILITELLDVNIGAYAHAVAEIDYKTFGVSPAAVTTVLTVPLPSLCISKSSTVPVSTVVKTTSATALPAVTSKPTTASDLSTPVATDTTSTPASGIFFESTKTASTFTLSSGLNSTSGAVTTSIPLTEDVTTMKTTLSLTTTNYPIGTPTPVSGNFTLTTTPTISAPPAPIISSNATGALTTKTIQSTTYITITSCSSTVLHCPATAASEIVLTSTIILYTTICPITQSVFPTVAPSTTSVISAEAIQTTLAATIPLQTLATPIVSVIYTPTFVNPTYTMPTNTATTYAPAFPNWNVTQSTIVPVLSAVVSVQDIPLATSTFTSAGVVTSVPVSAVGAGKEQCSSCIKSTSAVTNAGVAIPTGGVKPTISSACAGAKNGTCVSVTATGKVTGQAVPTAFVGSAARVMGSWMVGTVVAVVGMLML